MATDLYAHVLTSPQTTHLTWGFAAMPTIEFDASIANGLLYADP
jgi:hypothetical protein